MRPYKLSKIIRQFLLLLLLIYCISINLSCADSKQLAKGFRNPPQSAGIRCFWWWLNGNVTRQAITRDLEEMKKKGFSGALIVDAGGASQWGNKQVPAGPAFASTEWRELFRYAVSEADRLGLELSLNIQSGWNLGGPNVTKEMAAKKLTFSEIDVEGPKEITIKLPSPDRKGNFYRDIAVLMLPDNSSDKAKKRPISNLEAKAAFKELGNSAPDCRYLLFDEPSVESQIDCLVSEVLNVTDKLDANGLFKWQVPEGKWTILRFGYTITGAVVSTSSSGWKGLVIDYLDRDVFNRYWNEIITPLLEDIGPLVGKTLKYVHTDSWECGGANWSEDFRTEFIDRRGYDPIFYLPVLAGKIIDSRDASNSFLADFRKTIGDCIADNHYSVFSEAAGRYGMGIHPESGGPHAGHFDALKCLGRNDIPMGEFWVPSPHRPRPVDRFYVKQASSAAHIYGKQLVGAEAFTSIWLHWNDCLWSSLKPSFDHETCSGLNLVFVHTFTCSPKEMGLPGQEYFAGTHFNPNVTWWDYADGFITYLNRCQYLLQKGKFVADVLYYYGDHVPNLVRLKEEDPAKVMPGYDYDVTNEEVLLNRVETKGGRIVLPDGMSYHLLVLPDHKVLSPDALKKVHNLVKNGATVVGTKPLKMVSLVGLPASQKEFERLSDELWGDDESPSGKRQFGKGQVIWGKAAREVLQQKNISPDFEYKTEKPDAKIDYIHKTIGDIDVYFISNQNNKFQKATCYFRVEGRQPELWDALTGAIRPAKAFKQENGKTIIPIEFNPYGSIFVVFQKPVAKNAQGNAESNYRDYEQVYEINEPWIVRFDPNWGGPEKITFENLIEWTEHFEPGIKFYSGKAVYRNRFSFNDKIQKNNKYFIDLGQVGDVGIAGVRLNGKDLDVVWTTPFRVNITEAVKEGTNDIEITVVNSWRNRLIGDKNLPLHKKYTRTNITVRDDWQLSRSGLVGPVRILKQKK